MGTQPFPGAVVFVDGGLRSSAWHCSPCCKTHRVMSPSTSEVSAGNTSSAAVSSPVPHSHLYCGWPPLRPVMLRIPNFADKDFIPSASQSIVVTTQ